jgi:predicted AAA+ superfamily ATPase
MIQRKAAKRIIELSKQFPIVTVTGPRQSGKTTLCKNLFKHLPYSSLENLDERSMATNDPHGFLNRFPDGCVIDEVQRVPTLLSYIQSQVDQHPRAKGKFILTGSHQFELMEAVTQSLAGRTALVKLLPLTLEEAYPKKIPNLESVIFKGFFPRLFQEKINPTDLYSFYVDTYLEKDVRLLTRIQNLKNFEVFLKMCAGRTGQILNYANLASDCGVDQKTIKHWITVLEASYVIRLLPAYYKNIQRRLVKAPKLYFLDTGLACFLLGIRKPEHLAGHPLAGALFETFVLGELWKHYANRVESDPLYYYRDQSGAEVDVIFDYQTHLHALEVKMAETINEARLTQLHQTERLGYSVKKLYLVYGGQENFLRSKIHLTSWKKISALVASEIKIS